MRSPPNGRALALPAVWAARPTASAKTVELPSPSDEELMARLQESDSKALETLFARHSRLVFGIAYRIVNNYSEAEEVVQESFFYVFQKASLFDATKGSAKGWIVQVAFSRARDRKAHLARRGFYAGTDIDALHDTLVGLGDVEREIGIQLDLSVLRSAFEDLSPVQKKTLELFYFEGLELREISERLKEPFGNVRHHFYRGLEKLRKSPAVKRLQERNNV
jgi:RNA polymerase sigma-70 factor (ECF subfamily)